MLGEKKAVGPYPAPGIEERHLLHTRTQAVYGDEEREGAAGKARWQYAAHLHPSLVHHRECQRVCLQPFGHLTGNRPSITPPADTQHRASVLGLRKRLADCMSVAGAEGHFLRHALAWRIEEGATATVDHSKRVGSKLQHTVHVLAVGKGGFEGYPALQTLHQRAAFREERERGSGSRRVHAIVTQVGTLAHVQFTVAGRLRLVIHRERATVELFIVAEKLIAHGPVEEPVSVSQRMGMRIFAPVELPAGIGPQFIESAVEGGVGRKPEETVALPAYHLQHLPLHQIAVVVEQFGIQNTAPVGGKPAPRLAQIGLEPDGVTQIIAGVVHVDVHLFLRIAMGKGLYSCEIWVYPIISLGATFLTEQQKK